MKVKILDVENDYIGISKAVIEDQIGIKTKEMVEHIVFLKVMVVYLIDKQDLKD